MKRLALKFPKPKRLKGRNPNPSQKDEAEKQRRGYTNPRSFVRLDGSEVLHGIDWKERAFRLRQRSNNQCEAKIHDDLCNRLGSDAHHIIPRSRRRDDRMSNLLWLSRACHLAEDPRKVRWSRK